MKTIYYGMVFLVLVALNSCEKFSTDDTPGNISGMGNNNGKLKIKEPFSLPEGLIFVDPITEKAPDGILPRYGSGSVHLKISILNYTDTAKTVFFPDGLLFECNSPDNHNLMLLQTCWVCFKPNSRKTFILDAYCVNLARKHPADPGITYEIPGITASRVMNNLTDLIAWRKINYEMTKGSSGSKTDIYLDVMQPLRDLVWKITDKGGSVTDDEKAFIESIPGLNEQEIPKKNNKGQWPGYFDEYVIKGN